jgi:hypothetical protein
MSIWAGLRTRGLSDNGSAAAIARYRNELDLKIDIVSCFLPNTRLISHYEASSGISHPSSSARQWLASLGT